MKLGSKIVLGFVATNVIYVILLAFIFFSAQPVRRDSTMLSRDLLPMLDQASQVQYSTAMEGYMTQEYSHSINADVLVEALTYNADIVKYLSYLEKNHKEINIPKLDVVLERRRSTILGGRFHKRRCLFPDSGSG